MEQSLLVTLRADTDAQVVQDSGAKVLATYPDSLLVEADEQQAAQIREAGVDAVVLDRPPVRIAGATFELADASAAEEAAPIPVDPDRVAYYIVELIGPPAADWLQQLTALGARLHGDLPGYRLLVGILARRLEALSAMDFVRDVTPYRPAMKISPRLLEDGGGMLTAETLASPPDLTGAEETEAVPAEQVEISLFEGESAAEVAGRVRAAGGVVISTQPRAVVAMVPRPSITDLAGDQGVQAILPHRFAELHNDQATAIMDAPPDRTFGTFTLRGTNQIVAVADSGLDTGNAATAHQDFQGRIDGIVSLPNALAPWALPPFDDGAADVNSGHGTHVAGSVLGDGARARALGDPALPVPAGTAPGARLFFQAIEQRANWKSAAQLQAEGRAPFLPQWPPRAVGLWGIPNPLGSLFQAAYDSGARIHTNSWGSPVAGLYTGTSRDVDDFMWHHRDMLILFSAGNEGVDVDGNGVIDADSIGAPGTAKNCLTVGASENRRPSTSNPPPGVDLDWSQTRWPTLTGAGHVSDDPGGMAAFSSRGPTDDGRVKPEVVAPGTNVLSTRSSVWAPAGPPPNNPQAPLWGDLPAGHPLRGLYCWSGGTSMSTPLVAGAAALVRQHLVEQRGHVQDTSKPSGALIKAILVNGARPLAGQFAGEVPAGVNTVAGFGRVDLMESLAPGALRQTLFADEPDHAVSTGQVRRYEVRAIDLARPLKITLAYTDAPSATGGAGPRNRLYLRLRRPDGTLADGDLTAFPAVSNVVQQVTIAAPVTGSYEIEVHGVSVTQHAPGAGGAATPPRQDFALAVSNAMGLSLNPVSVAQAIDTTGSMAFYNYMEPAKERATQLVDFLRINDRVSVTEFSARPGQPFARTPAALQLRTLTVPAEWAAVRAGIGAFFADGMTPIGAGLQEAFNQIGGEPPARPRGIVLLSDGFQNAGLDPMTVLTSIPVSVPIFAVALGPAASAPTLQAIANSRPGGMYATVAGDQDVHVLHEIYARLQAMVSGAALVGLSSAELGDQGTAQHELLLEPGVREATFTVSWAEDAKEVELEVVGPDGRAYDDATAGTIQRRGQTYAIVRVGAPQPGTWTVAVHNGAQGRVRHTVSAAAVSPLVLTADASKRTRRGILITAQLLDGARPVDDARVVARISLPTRSRADVLAEFGDKLREVAIPDELRERRRTEDQRLLLQLDLFARDFDPQGGGLFGRKEVEVELDPVASGEYAGLIEPAAAGNIAIEVLASGEKDGMPYRRAAGLTVMVPERRLLDEPARPMRIAVGQVTDEPVESGQDLAG